MVPFLSTGVSMIFGPLIAITSSWMLSVSCESFGLTVRAIGRVVRACSSCLSGANKTPMEYNKSSFPGLFVVCSCEVAGFWGPNHRSHSIDCIGGRERAEAVECFSKLEAEERKKGKRGAIVCVVNMKVELFTFTAPALGTIKSGLQSEKFLIFF